MGFSPALNFPLFQFNGGMTFPVVETVTAVAGSTIGLTIDVIGTSGEQFTLTDESADLTGTGVSVSGDEGTDVSSAEITISGSPTTPTPTRGAPIGIGFQVGGFSSTTFDNGTFGLEIIVVKGSNGGSNPTNQPPVAKDITVSTPENTPVTIDPVSVNSDPQKSPLTLTSTSTTTNGGTVEIVNNQAVYTPPDSFPDGSALGTDQFDYTVTDGLGLSSLGTITVNVVAPDTWTGLGNGTWKDALDWTEGVPINGDDLDFPADAEKKADCVDNLPDLTFGNVEIDAGYTFTTAGNDTLTVTNNVFVTGGASVCHIPVSITGAVNTFTVVQDAQLSLATTLFGKGNLTKAGAGELDLNVGNFTYTGTTTLQGGTLGVGSAVSLGTGPLIVSGGQTPVVITTPVGLKPLTLSLKNTLDLVQGTVTFPSGAWIFTGSTVVAGDVEIDPVMSGVVEGLVTLQGAITASGGSQILTVGGQDPLTLSGSIDANTTVAIAEGAKVTLGPTLHGNTGTIGVNGTLSSRRHKLLGGTNPSREWRHD